VIGRTVSHYKVLNKLGEGGMGVVYQAEDTKLERIVALKFLAPHLVQDSEVRRRFEREAKAAAVLSHPNVCHVYEIDKAEGKTFIAMAYVEGESLDEKIGRGPLKLDEALDIAQQIAKGLEAAHEKGIFHRDIKPENVIVDSKGHVTIMDFGLAQLTEASRLTKADQTMGTTAYMSPEQTQGSGTDHRTDIWSLGVVLYETVTGQQPFKGDYDQAVMYSILNEEPEPITSLRTGVPMEIERIVTKCLAKDRGDRYRDAGDLGVDLRTLGKRLASGDSMVVRERVEAAPTSTSTEPVQKTRIREKMWMTLAGVAVSAALAAFLLGGRQTLMETRVLSIVPPPGVRMANVYPGGPVLAPDGKKLMFIGHERDGRPRIWIRPLDSSEAYPIEGTEDALMPFWSPDSRFVGFGTVGGSSMSKVAIDGGSPQIIADVRPRAGASWTGREDRILFRTRRLGLATVPGSGGEPRPLPMAAEWRSISEVRFLPGSHGFLFYGLLPGEARGGLYVGTLPLDSSDPVPIEGTKVVAEASSSGWYAHTDERGGHIFYVQGRRLMVQAFDLIELRTTGEPVVIAENVAPEESGDFSVSLDGTIAFRQSPAGFDANLVWVDREGRTLDVVGQSAAYSGPELSPDGRYVAYHEGNEIYVLDLSRQVSMRFTNHPRSDNSLVWSPDGSRVVFRSSRGDQGPRLFSKSAFGTEAPEAITVPGVDGEPGDWGSNGYVSYQARINVKGTMDVRAIRVDSRGRPVGEEPLVVVDTPGLDEDSKFSPDGRWISYSSSESGTNQIYVQGFPEAGRRVQISVNGGTEAQWRGDGKELYFVAPDAGLMAVDIKVERGEFTPGAPTRLFTVSERPIPFFRGNYDVASDGSKFLVVRPLDPAPPVTIILNWKEKFLQSNLQ